MNGFRIDWVSLLSELVFLDGASCGRSVNQWLDFLDGWLAGVGVDGEDDGMSLCQRGEGMK